MNLIILMGRFTANPMAKNTQNGNLVANFNLAVDRISNGEKKTDFLRCVAFKNTAENINKYFKKGDSVLIQGSVQTRNYMDTQGVQRVITEVLVDKFFFTESKKSIEKSEPTNTELIPPPDIFGWSLNKCKSDNGFTSLADAVENKIPPHIIPNETRANHTPKYSMKNGFELIGNEGDLPF